MRIWKRMVFSAGLGLMMNLSSALTALAGTYFWSTEVENTITTGDIAVELSEYEMDEYGVEIPYQNEKVVLPGQNVSKIVRITNEANDAWIRAKVMYWSEDGIANLSDDLLGGIGADWVKAGGYYYYTRPFLTGEYVEFLRQIRIPAEWDSYYANQGFQVDVMVQAVQSANFVPDFSGEAPWFGIPVEACVHSEHIRKQASGSGNFEIVFENGTEGFAKSSEDFFQDFGSMMPGDTMTGVMEFGSNFHRLLDISFRTELLEGQAEESQKLLHNLKLKIMAGENLLYEGTLGADELNQGITLINGLKKGENQRVTYQLFMPETMTNASALRQAAVRWVFQTSYRSSSGGDSSGSSSSSDKSVVQAVIEKPIQKLKHATQEAAEYLGNLPGTGDTGNGVLLIVMIISGTAAFLLSKKGDGE